MNEQIENTDPQMTHYDEILLKETSVDNPKNISFVISQIYGYFEKINQSTNQNETAKNINEIENSLGYLGEKYKDSPEQKEYIKKLEEIINYLRTNLLN